jgi:uncharacterized membrane protein HdeD (DUF308 family)
MFPTRDEFGLASRWGWVVARGVAAILFGLFALARPGAMSLGLVLLFGAYALIGGIAAVVAAAERGRAGYSWGMLLLDGLLGMAIGVLSLLAPATMAFAFVWVLGIWALATGALEIASAFRLRKVIKNEWALGLAGLASVALGAVMLYKPLAGGLAIVWWLGAYALVFGVFMTVLGFRLRSHQHMLAGGGYVPGREVHLPA